MVIMSGCDLTGLDDETREGGEGFIGHVMFESFGVGFGGFARHADFEQYAHHQLVAGAHFLGEGFTGRGEENAAVGARGGEAFALEPGYGAAGGDVADAEAAGNFDGAGFAGLGNQIGDELGIIFQHFIGAGMAGFAETVRLFGFLGQGRGIGWQGGGRFSAGGGAGDGIGPGVYDCFGSAP